MLAYDNGEWLLVLDNYDNINVDIRKIYPQHLSVKFSSPREIVGLLDP